MIIDIQSELNKLKRQKRKNPPEQILEELLQQKGMDHTHLTTLFALAKKTPLYINKKKTLTGLQKLL